MAPFFGGAGSGVGAGVEKLSLLFYFSEFLCRFDQQTLQFLHPFLQVFVLIRGLYQYHFEDLLSITPLLQPIFLSEIEFGLLFHAVEFLQGEELLVEILLVLEFYDSTIALHLFSEYIFPIFADSREGKAVLVIDAREDVVHCSNRFFFVFLEGAFKAAPLQKFSLGFLAISFPSISDSPAAINCLIDLQMNPLNAPFNRPSSPKLQPPPIYLPSSFYIAIFDNNQLLAMRFKSSWKYLYSSLKKSSFLKLLRRVLFQQSHLSPYLPIMKEDLLHKIFRLNDDDACQYDEPLLPHSKNHKKSINNELSSFFFISKSCFDPISKWMMLWYCLVCLSIIIIYFTTGMTFIFGFEAWDDLQTSPFTIWLNIICIIVFMGDIYVQLNAGFLSRGMIIMEKERAVSRYLRYFFLIDLILVVVLVISMVSDYFYMNVFKIIIVLKFIRMFEIDDLFMRKWSTAVNKKALYVIGKQLITIFVIAHTIGILFYAIDYALTKTPACINDNSLCWLYSATTYSPIMEYGWRLRYFYSLYWGVNTIATISYGDIAPNNPQEVAYALACFCFSLIAYGYVVNNIIRIIIWARSSRDNFRVQLILYSTYMDNLQIGKEVQYQFRDYLESQYFQEKERSFSLEEEMKSRLPIDLKEELIKSAYYHVNNGLQFMLCSSPSIVKLLYFLEEKKFTENEKILAQGEPLNRLYYLHKGEVELSCLHYQKLYNIHICNTSDEFLSLYEFFLNQRAAYSIKTSKNTTMYFLSKQKIEHQLQKYTDLRQNFKLVEYELRFDNAFAKIFYQCFFCKMNHHWYRCSNVFPSFFHVTLLKHSFKATGKRITEVRCNAWKNRGMLKSLMRLNVNTADKILRKLQERVYSLKKIKEQRRADFDVDAHHEWLYFQPRHNLSKFKEEWNKRRHRKTLPSRGILPIFNMKAMSMP